MSWQKIALLILGLALLAPGLCGAFFVPVTLSEMYSVAIKGRQAQYLFGLAPMFSLPSVSLGFVGIFLISKIYPKPSLAKAADWTGNFAIFATIIFLSYWVMMFSLASLTWSNFGEFGLIFLFCILAGVLPIYYLKNYPKT